MKLQPFENRMSEKKYRKAIPSLFMFLMAHFTPAEHDGVSSY